jgi:putative hemolysin
LENYWLYIFLALVASAFFSGIEIAFFTANKLKIELSQKKGGINAKIISFLVKKQARFIGTLLVGNCIALVVFSMFMEQKLTSFLSGFLSSGFWIFLLTTLLSTLVILFTAEFLPKNLFRLNPNGLLNIFAIPVLLSYLVLSPLVFIITGFSSFLMRTLFRVKVQEADPSFGRVDLDNLVRETLYKNQGKRKVDHEVKIFKNALDFARVKARGCMVPRTEIIAVPVDISVEDLKRRFIETRLSRILVYQESIDHIIGFVHSYELFKNPDNVRSLLLPVIIIPETMPAKDALTLFIQQRKSIAVVLDEFGGTAGILTMEDVMEEIFGEIEDEHDKDELIERRISDSEFVFSGRMEIDYINEKYQTEIPKKEGSETLGGLIVNLTGTIPAKGEKINLGKLTFTVLNVSQTRIETLGLKIGSE